MSKKVPHYGGFQTSVIECAKPQSAKMHPIMQPVELVKKLVENSSIAGDLVLDCFIGSGTTLVACEQTGRLGWGMELTAEYTATALERLSLLGLTPQRIETVGHGKQKQAKRHKTGAKGQKTARQTVHAG